jgi:hypothetical protein
MSKDEFDIIRGSGNVFRDLGHPRATVPLLAARIIGVLNDRALTVRAAHELTGFAAAAFSRIRQAKLDHFTIDRLRAILAGLGRGLCLGNHSSGNSAGLCAHRSRPAAQPVRRTMAW